MSGGTLSREAARNGEQAGLSCIKFRCLEMLSYVLAKNIMCKLLFNSLYNDLKVFGNMPMRNNTQSLRTKLQIFQTGF